MKSFLASLLISSLSTFAYACTTDEDCNLNGVCSSSSCVCDPGWRTTDCGELDLRPATYNTGYNHTLNGTSSWGAKIIHDPNNEQLYHLFVADFADGCGLDYWSPYSRIARAESTTGPAGPYTFSAEIVGTFAHNPTVVYSEVDSLYLLYYIGCPRTVAATCTGQQFTCGTGTWPTDGESGINLQSSPDLVTWTDHGVILAGDEDGTWDVDTTNPSPFPLYSPSSPTAEILLAYRGWNSTGNNELIGVASAPHFGGPYTRTHTTAIFSNINEDPFVWRDARGNFHLLMHTEEPWTDPQGSNVGRHAFARSWDGAWTYNNLTLAYNTTVDFTDGTSIQFARRERPQLFFSEDGNMTPLYLTNGVQEQGSKQSYTVIVPLGGK